MAAKKPVTAVPVRYVGTSDIREISAESFADNELDHGTVRWEQGQTQPVYPDAAEFLLALEGEFELGEFPPPEDTPADQEPEAPVTVDPVPDPAPAE